MKKSIITIVGGGSSAHTVIPMLSNAGNTINILTHKPHRWSHNITSEYILPDGSLHDSITGSLNKITSNPEDIIPYSDIIILCMPVSQYRNALDIICKYIVDSEDVFLGTVYGQAGFNWMVEEAKRKYELKKVSYFAFGLIPWICRIREYGRIGITYGAKERNYLAINDKSKFSQLSAILLEDICFKWFKKGHFELSENFISLTLSVDNQIIHPSRLYGLYLKSTMGWSLKEDVPMFYRDYDKLSVSLLENLDSDYTKIRNKIMELYPMKDFKYMLNYLDLERLSYGSNSKSILESFQNSKTLNQIETPTVQNDKGDYVLNKDHRFFWDDIYYGLCIAKWLAQKMSIKTNTIDDILIWAQELLGDKIIDNKSRKLFDIDFKEKNIGIPSVYAYNNIEELID